MTGPPLPSKCSRTCTVLLIDGITQKWPKISQNHPKWAKITQKWTKITQNDPKSAKITHQKLQRMNWNQNVLKILTSYPENRNINKKNFEFYDHHQVMATSSQLSGPSSYSERKGALAIEAWNEGTRHESSQRSCSKK